MRQQSRNNSIISRHNRNNRDNGNKRSFTWNVHVSRISELMKRELDSNPWCRVSGSREGSTAVCPVGEEEPGQTFAGGKKRRLRRVCEAGWGET